ncbi:12218_t:CDS:10, partial [Ambispora leptoticha]
ALEKKIDDYPPYVGSSEPTYYGDFRQVYREKNTAELARIKGVAQAKAEEYQAVADQITPLLEKIKDIEAKYKMPAIPASGAVSPATDPTKSENGTALSSAQRKFFTENQPAIKKGLLELEKAVYLVEVGAELSKMEKDNIESAKNKYFTDATKLGELQAGFVLTDYQTSTGKKLKINCLSNQEKRLFDPTAADNETAALNTAEKVAAAAKLLFQVRSIRGVATLTAPENSEVQAAFDRIFDGLTTKIKTKYASLKANKKFDYQPDAYQGHNFALLTGLTPWKAGEEVSYSEVLKALETLGKINTETDIRKLVNDFTDENIMAAYSETEAKYYPYRDLQVAREAKRLELFKDNFEKAQEPTGLAKDGKDERTAYELGWKNPQGEPGKYSVIRGKKTNYFALDLKQDIERQTRSSDLETFWSNRTAEFNNLKNNLLPADLKKNNLITLYQTTLKNLKEDEFIADFVAQNGEAKQFAEKQNNRDKVLAFQVRPVYRFDADNAPGSLPLPTQDEIWAYSKEGKARGAYGSHSQPVETDLNMAEISRIELDKANRILERISQAQQVSDLPTEPEIEAIIENKVTAGKNHASVKTDRNAKKAQLEQRAADQQARTAAIQAEENRLKTLLQRAKAQPEITAIAEELNKKPVVDASELQNSDYQTEMSGLASDDSQRATRKDEILAEITRLRTAKLDQVRTILSTAKGILDKDGATKEELEQAVNDLKTLANAPADSAEQIVPKSPTLTRFLPEPRPSPPSKITENPNPTTKPRMAPSIIDSKKTELTAKIDTAKAQEKPTPEKKAEEVKKLKTPEQIKEFITKSIPEQEKAEFTKHLSELTEVEKPTGSGEEEQFKNFMAQQNAEVVVKAVCSYKLKKDDNLRNEIATEMENQKDSEGQALDEKVYPKKDGKYTPEAMVKYLFEKKTGQAHAFSAKKVEVKKIDDENIKIDGVQITIDEYNSNIRGYSKLDMQDAIEYKKLDDEIFGSIRDEDGEYLPDHIQIKESRKVRYTDYALWKECKRRIREDEKNLKGTMTIMKKDKYRGIKGDDEVKIQDIVRKNNAALQRNLDLYRATLPFLRDLISKKVEIGQGLGTPLVNPDADLNREEK